MGRPAKLLSMICVECGAKADLSAAAARLRGWELWLGGGRCPVCVRDGAGAEPLPPLPPKIAEKLRSLPTVLVRCSGCGEVFESEQEYDDGWRPGAHWISSPGQRAAARARGEPIPLCSGWNIAGEPVQIPPADPGTGGPAVTPGQ